MNPALPAPGTVAVGGNPFLPGGQGAAVNQAAQNQPTIWDDIKNFFSNTTVLTPEGADKLMQPNAARAYKNLMDLAGLQGARTSTSAFAPPERPQNEYVGRDIGISPNFITDRAISNMFPGVGAIEASRLMREKGYQKVYQAGVGGVWVKMEQSSSPASALSDAASGSIDERGRPEFVDPTALEYGERITAQSGLTFVGGQDYTDPSGKTVSQYAMTIPNSAAARDTKGRYKWVKTVKKDKDGNWVAIYSQQLRKSQTRSHRKKVYARQEQARAQQKTQTTNSEISQLVNLRVDYG